MRKGENALFFIEEPELSLHPGMQRVFLETLLSEEFSTMQFFFTTHSNHFLDITMDTKSVSVYGFKKIKDGDFKINVLEGGDQNILKDLGVLNSSVFLSNCTIWVEGITDRKYLRHFMSLYINKEQPNNKFLEDLHYSFVEYAGSNITHWDFEEDEDSTSIDALKLNNNIFLIVDSDVKEDGTKDEAKTKRHNDLRKALKEALYITEGKEMENMLTPSTVKAVVASFEKLKVDELSFKGKINEVVDGLSHNSTTTISKPVYWNKNLGKYIDQKLKDKKRKASYADGNTISAKDKFCDLAIESIKSYEDLSDEAKKLCAKIYEFISKHNQ